MFDVPPCVLALQCEPAVIGRLVPCKVQQQQQVQEQVSAREVDVAYFILFLFLAHLLTGTN